MAAALPWIALAFTVGSTAYQYQQQKKARKKAKAEADARKGFELVIEGSPGVLPIVYGRAKVGGVRCFHNTSSNFNYIASNANKTFDINLSSSQSGAKNEFLIFQQAICQGGISSVKDIIINETQFLNDPVLYDNAGIRVDVHFSGEVVDPLLKANAPDRSAALFTNIAYANVYVKLNRDDPQFGGVPDIQFLVEGRKVRKVLNGILQTTYVYSNNPAWVLLDYLLEFRKVPVEDIILSSFEQSAALAETVKLVGATVGGNFYRPALSTETALFGRAIPLYEANIALDSAKPFRENVEAILETMGDARLVWSQGKYKLNAQYPGLNNENIIISDYITDDDLVLGKPITINWPSAEERLNSVTVRFNNESENFKEDTVSWPNKPNSSYTRGIGGFVYPAVSGWDTSAGGRLLNAYGVWNKGSNTANLVYKIKVKVTGDHIFRFTADDSVSGSVGEYTFHPNAWTLYLNGQPTGTSAIIAALSGTSWRSVKTETMFLEAGKVYEIKLNATNNKDIKGIAATLTDPSNVVIWTTREPSYAGFEEISSNNTTYLQMLAEDNNVELETDIFLQGTTDYYHAKAKAEELVRTSRTAFNIKFTYIAKDKYLEPGDVIQLSSESIQIGLEGPLYIRVSSISLKPDFQCEIQGTRFDGTQLAWNVADNEYLRPISSYSEELPAPYYLEYVPEANDIHNGPGSFNWPPVDDSRIISYNLYMHKEGEVDAGGNNLFKKIGSTPNPPFGLPDLLEEDLIFGIKSVANTGRMSKMTVTNLVNLVRATPPAPSNVTAVAYGDRNQSVKITWEIPLERPDGSIYNNHFVTFIYRSKVNDIALAQKIGESLQSTEYIDTPSEFGTLYYWVKFISYAGVSGVASDPVSIVVDFWQVFVDDLFKPPAPTNLQASGVVNSIILTWEQTSYSGGGGHDYAIIYGQKWPDGQLEPTFSYETVISTVKDAKIYRHTVEPGERWVYWVKEKSRNSGLSDGYAGPAVAVTEYDSAKLVSALSGHIAKSTLSAELQAEIDSVDTLAIQAVSTRIDDIYGSYTIKIDHNNYVSGYGLASEANDGTPISSFIVAADRFAIGAPTVENGDFNLNNQYPFIHLSTPTVVDGITMEPGTYLKRALIADATITNAKIVTLNAEKITTGYLNAERIEAGSIKAGKIDSRGLSIYDEFGNVILAAGSGLEGLEWDYVKGAAKPQDGATVGAPTGTLVGGTEASALVSTANAAQTAANNALAALSDISADNKLTPAEKTAVRKEWDAIYGERAGIRSQADSFGITTEKTNYDNDFQALGTYMNGGVAYTIGATPPSLISDAKLELTDTMVGATFRTNWANLYTTRQTLLNKISAEAAMRANWENVTGSGKPQNNATVGATFGDYYGSGKNISGTITPGNITTYIANAAIGNAQIGGDIYSSNWSGWGGAGWLLDRSGNFYCNNIYARGDIEASSLKANTAMVQTLNIAGNAVIVPTYVEYPSSAAYDVYQNGTEAEWTLLSDVVTVNVDCSALIFIGCNDIITPTTHTVSAGAGSLGHYNWPTGTEWASIRLYRNGSLVKRLAQWNVSSTKKGNGRHTVTYSNYERDCVFIDTLVAEIHLVAGTNTIDIRGWVRMADGNGVAKRNSNSYMLIMGTQR